MREKIDGVVMNQKQLSKALEMLEKANDELGYEFSESDFAEFLNRRLIEVHLESVSFSDGLTKIIEKVD